MKSAGCRALAGTRYAPGRPAIAAASRREPLSHWHLALALAAGAISGVVKSKTGRVLVVRATPTRKTRRRNTERDDGSVAGRASLTFEVRAGHRAWDADTRLADPAASVDHPLIAVP